MTHDSSIPFEHPFKDDDLSTLEALKKIMAALRAPVTGCPWDIEQTFQTIARYTLEEAYEVADAIEQNDMDSLCEELGDLLLQVVYHARMAEEEGAFDLADVVQGISAKMIRRHPHVFGDDEMRSAGAAKGFWEKIKAEEKLKKNINKDPENIDKKSILDNIPRNFPALLRAEKLQNKAARIGFDWPNTDPVIEKIEEELTEVREAMERGVKSDIAEEIGDLLFVVANLARHNKVDPEDALRRANAKFTRRFHHIESEFSKQGRSLEGSRLEEMDKFWDDAKSKGL